MTSNFFSQVDKDIDAKKLQKQETGERIMDYSTIKKNPAISKVSVFQKPIFKISKSRFTYKNLGFY